jgi:hypothetical protein
MWTLHHASAYNASCRVWALLAFFERCHGQGRHETKEDAREVVGRQAWRLVIAQEEEESDSMFA